MVAVVLNLVALAGSGISWGASLACAPLAAAYLAFKQRGNAWVVGAAILNWLALLGFGFWGATCLLFVSLTGAFLVLALCRSRACWWLAGGYALFIQMFQPALGLPRAPEKVVVDATNVHGIQLLLARYRAIHTSYPPRLSALEGTVGNWKWFTSPRGASELNPYTEGPFRLWGREPYPGRVREIHRWREVDDGDYLYIPPPDNPAPKAIMLMTRPGLLYRNTINIGYVDGTVETVDAQIWQERTDVQSFLRTCGAITH